MKRPNVLTIADLFLLVLLATAFFAGPAITELTELQADLVWQGIRLTVVKYIVLALIEDAGKYLVPRYVRAKQAKLP